MGRPEIASKTVKLILEVRLPITKDDTIKPIHSSDIPNITLIKKNAQRNLLAQLTQG